ILSRAGANSIWECSVCGKPLVLIPLCGSGTRGDQVDNANFFKESGAAAVLVGEQASSENLRNELTKLLDAGTREKMSENSRKLSDKKRPALSIAELIFEQVNK
ncbi:MAG: UDP-N-acetylglucosamine--N-acetylmuramyl-(pentapeptide) pyrophosphoryl-undecaprenol N-acetylglucosamine transferase, partial [Treponema sp.]|nr:UDP-N-acetylglucosamine--N-acetylmuramyl-(pentapeptide) pyrophosphoryl-undecaprenol N-acetylglucosamine transferase [Treponema sp.]